MAHKTGHVTPINPVDVLDSTYVQRQISRAQENITKDPELAIGTAKELLETTCKSILAKLREPLEDDLPALVRATLKRIDTGVTGAADAARAGSALRRLTGSLSGLGAAIAEVRNAIGTGHGRDASMGDIDPMYARLAVNATATLVTFMMDRFRAIHNIH